MNAQLYVNALGKGRITLGFAERMIPALVKWDGKMPFLLFMYVLEKGEVTRNEIFKAIWPDLGIQKATNNFHVAKGKILPSLEKAVGVELPDVLIYQTLFYQIADQRWAGEQMRNIELPHYEIAYDVREFENAVRRLMEADSVKMEEWQEAISLYTGDFLTDENSEWVVTRRTELQEKYVTLLVMAANAVKPNNPEQALSWLLFAFETQPIREDVHRKMMMLYMEVGKPEQVVEFYAMVKKKLNELGYEPTTRTKALYMGLTGKNP